MNWLRQLTDKAGYASLRPLLRHLNDVGPRYLTFHERPKRSDDVGLKPEPELALEKSAIVMQGPIAAADDATVETCRLYRRFYPDCHLILSTWVDTPDAELQPLRDLGVEVVLSEKPDEPRLFNLNMQIRTAGAGVRRAVEAGAEWVMKTRTDQRLYEPNALGYLAELARAFPANGDTAQKHRIIGVGQGSLRLCPYHVTDQTVFGHAEDMKRYWDIPLRTDPVPEHWPKSTADVYDTVPMGELMRGASAEPYFASQFLQSLGRELPWTVEDSWAAYRDHFLFADYRSTGFYWIKGQMYSLWEHTHKYDHISSRQEIGFVEWLMLYSGRMPPESGRRFQSVLKGRYFDAVPAL